MPDFHGDTNGISWKFIKALDELDALLRLEELLELLSEQIEHMPFPNKYVLRAELLLEQYRTSASPHLHEARSLLGDVHVAGWEQIKTKA